LLETKLQRKSGRNGKKLFYSSFVKQRFCNGIKRFRNGTETVHLQRSEVLRGNAYATIISVSEKLIPFLLRNDNRFHPFAMI
jgi:hypothetical protein